jgi:HTH-type transcriptional regulator, transcriptional repressor of NAD biosynthesis genes
MTRKLYRHGLVIGKFYPPHLGHEYLIRSAALHSHAVTVLVLGSSVESLSIDRRVQWLQSAFTAMPQVRIVGALDDVPVNYEDTEIWQAHVDIMREAVSQADEMYTQLPAVDAIYSSEPYGDRLASYFHCQHVCLDQSRSLYPTSGTAVRANVTGQWQMLSPSVQAGLAMRVVVVGAESTGTTTLSQQLVSALRTRGGIWTETQCVAEYGREYTANLLALAKAVDSQARVADIDWQSADFAHVAEEQCRRENAAAAYGSPVLVCDTDAWVTRIWHERYMGTPSTGVDALAAGMPSRALYILTSEQGIPFEDDGLRDGEHLRSWMGQRFRDELNAQAIPWIEVHGSPEQRLTTALHAVDDLMSSYWNFSSPLPITATESH